MGRGGRLARLLGRVESWLEAERDQLALWLPVALGTGIAGWFALPTRAMWIALMLTALGLGAASATLGATRRAARAGATFALVAAIGVALIWWRAEHVAAPRLERIVVTSFEGAVTAVDRLPAREIVRLTLEPTAGAELPPRVRVNVADGDVPAGVEPGTRVRLRARLMPPPPAAVPGAYDFAQVAWFRGLGATGRALGPVVVIGAAEGGAGAWLAGLRARLSAHIQASAPAGTGGVATALATGDQGAITEEDAEAMRRSGLAHLLSISGLHVSAVVAAAMLLTMRLLALSRRVALHAPLLLVGAGAGAAAGVGYTLLAGAEVPTLRACVAALLVLIGMALGREAITLRLVATGALVVLLFWPEAVAGPSFQLSFAAVTAIVAFHEQRHVRALFAARDEAWTRRAGRLMLSLLLTGLVVELALTPIALFHFHRAGLYGAAANIVAIPLTTFVIMPLEAFALLLDVTGLGAPFWWLTGQAIALLLALAHVVAGAPGAVAALPAMPGEAFALLVIGGLWLALWRTPVRYCGLVPVLAGAVWGAMTPAPDILVTGDGRHLAVRTAQGGLALLRPRAGDYMRDVLGQGAGIEGEGGALDDLPRARCTRDLCAAELMRGGRRWRLLATRSPYRVEWPALTRACAASDIVVSDRRLPSGCTPRWLKLDRPALEQTGGVAIRLESGTVATVAGGGEHPWLRR